MRATPPCSSNRVRPYGILITNGQFVSFRGEDPTMIVVDAKNKGSVRFVNCSFWGPCHQIARIAGRGTVGLSDCNFCDWDTKREGRAAIQVSGGTVLVRGCDFQQDKPCIRLEAEVRGGVVTGNIFRTATPITDNSGGTVVISGNSEIGQTARQVARRSALFRHDHHRPRAQDAEAFRLVAGRDKHKCRVRRELGEVQGAQVAPFAFH